MASSELHGSGAMPASKREQQLEKELNELKQQYINRLRELSAMSSLRETIASSVLQVSGRLSKSCSPNEFAGPGISPCDSNYSSASPPHGAEDPGPGKLGRWLNRNRQPPPTPEITAPENESGKLNRWLNRSKAPSKPEVPIPEPPAPPSSKLSKWLERTQIKNEDENDSGKLSRWLNRAKTEKPSVAAKSSSHDWSEVSPRNDNFEQEINTLTARIKHSWNLIDAALSIISSDRNSAPQVESEESTETEDGGEQLQALNGLRCPSCGVEIIAGDGGLCARAESGGVESGGGCRGLGLRVEEGRKGLFVTHVVPEGLADSAGFLVKDIIRTVDGRAVRGLKDFGDSLRDGADGGSLTIEISRGAGIAKRDVCLYVRTRDGPGGPAGGDLGAVDGAGGDAEQQACGAGGSAAEALLQSFLQARRNERSHEKTSASSSSGKGEGRSPAAEARKQKSAAKFNKYGKDTKLWVPESEAMVIEAPGRGGGGGAGGAVGGEGAARDGKRAEIGGFYFFPPGHPDYVPLPPGEAALIAGRQDVHPQERLAPHWSQVVFQSPSGAEIRAQARHATYGSIEAVSGKLVRADPLIAQTELNNAGEVAGCVVYVKRGGAPFTKKARVAVAAGAIACIVANHDRETFGMSYTDDGLPFAALNIPCVMISSDIAEKLDASNEWRVTLTPAKPEQQGSKRPPKAEGCPVEPSVPGAGPAQGESPAGPVPGGLGLKGLPVKPKGGGLGKPGAKPTMWKKIRLFLP